MDPRPDHGETSFVGRGPLAGHKALVTGADSGVGRFGDYLRARRRRCRLELSLRGGDRPGDVTDKAFCVKLVETAKEELVGLDILVDNAGKQTNQSDISENTDEQFDRTLNTNVYAKFWIRRAALGRRYLGATGAMDLRERLSRRNA